MKIKLYFMVLAALSVPNVFAADDHPIIKATKKGDLKLLQEYISFYPTFVDMQDKNTGRTPLIHAIEKDHNLVALWLINKGADVNAKSWGGGVPLTAAVWFNNYVGAALLLNHKASINLLDRTTILERALSGNRLGPIPDNNMIALLLDYYKTNKINIPEGTLKRLKKMIPNVEFVIPGL